MFMEEVGHGPDEGDHPVRGLKLQAGRRNGPFGTQEGLPRYRRGRVNYFRWLRTGPGGQVSGGELRAAGSPGSVIPSSVVSGLTGILRAVLLTGPEARSGGLQGMSFRRPRPSRPLVILPLGSPSLLPSAVRKAPRSGGARGRRSPRHTYAPVAHIRHNFLILSDFRLSDICLLLGRGFGKPGDASGLPVAPEEKGGGMDQGPQKFGRSSRRPCRSLEDRCP
jgi:hypothetical protein